MKKLKATIPDGGAPLGKFPVLREIFDEETKTAIEALLFSVVDGDTQGVVLKGCAVTGIVSDYDIAEGYVYLDGEVMFYPGVEGLSAVNYVKAATATEESGVFADGVSKAFIDVQNAVEFTTTGGGSGTQYITFNFDQEGRTLANGLGPEYGTFTPTVSFNGASVGITYSSQFGYYTKTLLSNGTFRVEGLLEVGLSSKGSSTGTLRIDDLPEISSSTIDTPCSAFLPTLGSSRINFAGFVPCVEVIAGTDSMEIKDRRDTEEITDVEIVVGSDPLFRVSFSYFTAG